jgi:hypothetical protein
MLQPRRTLLLYLTVAILSTCGLLLNKVDCETGNLIFFYSFLVPNLQIPMTIYPEHSAINIATFGLTNPLFVDMYLEMDSLRS